MTLDREMTPNYQLVAQATDGGGRWCHAQVKLTVTDVNDNPPIFTLSQYTASVYEDTATKALLTRIQAIDPDEGDTAATTAATAASSRTITIAISGSVATTHTVTVTTTASLIDKEPLVYKKQITGRTFI